MTPDDFPQYAELWKEQIDPEELAQLQAMAKNIERTARRKRLLDLSLGFGFVGPACLILWIYPVSLLAKFGFVLLGAMVFWVVWWRHQITRASRATAIDDPRVFFEKTIKNVQSELNLSTISFFLAVPAFFGCVVLTNSLHGRDGIALFLRALRDGNPKVILILSFVILGGVYFARDNLKLREQLRRLESMSREWDEQQLR